MDVDKPLRSEAAHLARRTTLVVAVTLVFALGAILAWLAATALLIVFAGIVLAVILDSGARLLGRLLPVRRIIRLVIVVLAILAMLVTLLAVGGATIAGQFGQFVLVVDEQIGNAITLLGKAGLEIGGKGGLDLSGAVPDASAMFGGATEAIASLFGVVGNAFFILVLGAFFAADPHVYKRGLVSLVPPGRRARVAEVLDETGEALHHWVRGQLFGMALIFTLSFALLSLIGMPYAILLALQAGLLTFIPTIGPVFAGIPMILTGLSQGWEMALAGVAVYALIEFAEGNFITPMIQQRAVELPPALTLGFQLVMGALFGVLGIALAVPLAACLKVLIERLYVNDALGGSWAVREPDPR